MNTLSWRTPTTPLPTENNPRVVFERLFGDGGTAAQRLAQCARSARSILDAVSERHRPAAAVARRRRPAAARRISSTRSAKSSGASRRPKPGRRCLAAGCWSGRSACRRRFDEHVKLMFDLQWLAYQADVTRVFTFMLGPRAGRPHLSRDRRARAASWPLAPPRRPAEAREARQDQHLSHGAVRALPREAAQATPDGDGTLLDHVAAALRRRPEQPERALAHRPAAAAGRRGGQLKGGRHLQYPEGHADDEPAADDARPGRRAGRDAAATAPAARPSTRCPASDPTEGNRRPSMRGVCSGWSARATVHAS